VVRSRRALSVEVRKEFTRPRGDGSKRTTTANPAAGTKEDYPDRGGGGSKTGERKKKRVAKSSGVISARAKRGGEKGGVFLN